MNRFSEPFKTALGEYCTHVLRLLEMDNWRLTLIDDFPPSADAAAEIRCIYGRRVGEMKLQQGFFDDSSEQQQHYVVHEIVHMMVDGIDNVIENGVETLIGRPAYTVLHEAWNVQVEYLVDHLAYVLVDLMDGPNSIGLWENVLRAERGEDPLPEETVAAARAPRERAAPRGRPHPGE